MEHSAKDTGHQDDLRREQEWEYQLSFHQSRAEHLLLLTNRAAVAVVWEKTELLMWRSL